MTHTSDERATETVLFSGMCARNFAKTESAITVQRVFSIKFDCQPPNDKNILCDITSLKQLAVFVEEKVRDDQGCNRNRRRTASGSSRQLFSATSTTVSRQTVYRRLGHIGLYARRPVRCVPLTATHCRLQLTWSIEHALWTPQQVSSVVFSDESRFSWQSDSRRTLIWRAPGTRYHQENTIERHRYSGAGWLV
ncbi:transposable element Tcb1 transposase [Trichonephila clavipes]|nr:transposable element Tcb1 transposase [Trichonephila clavipes]